MNKLLSSDLRKAIYLAFSRTYIKALTEITPGDGETHSNWDLRFQGNNIIIYNEPTGDNILFTNDGTRPHIIRAKEKKYLRFKKGKEQSGQGISKGRIKIPGNKAFEKDGYIFAKMVYHPGIREMRYIEHIMEDKNLEKECRKILEDEIEKLILKVK